MSLLVKAVNITRKEGFAGISKRISKNLNKNKLQDLMPQYFFKEEPDWINQPDKKAFHQLKDKFKGKRCFIVGNGPSLNKIDLKKLENEYSFAVNGIFYKTQELGFKPTFYVVEDSHVMKDNVEAINNYDCQYRFFPTDYKKYIKPKSMNGQTLFFRMNRGFYEKTSPNFGIPRFSTDASERLYCGQSVTIINLQLAFYMGFSEVYLLGMDFSYQIPQSAIIKGLSIESTEDDPNHFHPDYFGKGKKWHDPQLEMVLKNYQMCKMAYEWDGRKIYNATVGGKLETFERKEFNSLFETK